MISPLLACLRCLCRSLRCLYAAPAVHLLLSVYHLVAPHMEAPAAHARPCAFVCCLGLLRPDGATPLSSFSSLCRVLLVRARAALTSERRPSLLRSRPQHHVAVPQHAMAVGPRPAPPACRLFSPFPLVLVRPRFPVLDAGPSSCFFPLLLRSPAAPPSSLSF